MKNSANTNSTNKSVLLPAIMLSTALAQGCATTNEQVKNALEMPPQEVATLEAQKLHDKLLSEANKAQYKEAKIEKASKNTQKVITSDNDLSPQKATTFLPTVKYDEVYNSLPEIYKTSNTVKSSDLKMNLGVNGLSVINGNSRYNLGYQYSEQFGSIVGLEYGYMNGKWGTLATVKIGGEKKSFLLTGVYQGVDWGVKASVGALFQKFEGKTINQNFAGVEVIRDLSQYIEGLSVKGYANATHTQDKTLSVTEISNKVAGGTEFITTTEEFKGGTNIGGGVGFNYDINDSHSVHGSVGYTSMNGGGADALIGYEYRNDKLKLGADYSTRNTGEFGADTYAAKVAYIIQPGLSAELTGRLIDSDTLDDKQIGINFSYTPGLKTFDKQGSKISLANLTPVTGANQAMDVLYGKKVTTVEKRFVADKVVDTQAPVLSSTNQSFFTTVGVPLTLVTVTANDNVDGALTVTQSGTVDFNTAGTYTVTYTATDSASNASSITHTYVVNAAPVLDTTAPVLSSTTQTFTTTAGTPLTLVTVTANDNVDGALTVTQTGTVDFNTAGTYTVTYSATDAASNASTITHTYVVNAAPVLDTTAPVLSSTTQTFTTTAGTPLTLATVTANDNVDGALTVTQTGTVDFNTVGTYTVTYTATDSASNASSITHTYVVNAAPVLDTTAPVLSSTTQTFTTTAGTPLTLATVTANDNVDGALTVTQTGTVDFNTAGTYTVTYSATDAASNASTITHTYVVNAAPVLDTTAPVLSSTTQTFTTTAGTPLTLATVTANDNVDGALTVTQSGTVDFNTVGTYTVTYSATDAASNASSITHTYVVNAVPNTAPTGQNITTSAGYANSFTLDLSSYLSDAEGNPVTAQFVGSGVLFGDIVISGASITGNSATITVNAGTGNGYIDYQVTDGTDTNPTVYRITINSLDGI